MATIDKDFKVKNGLVVSGEGLFGGTVEVAEPTANAHAATKLYVDQSSYAVYVSSSSTTYTISQSDIGKNVEISNSASIVVTIPTDSSVNFPIGSYINIFQAGVGQITVSAASGVTLQATPGKKLRSQFSMATVVKRSANTWLLYGDLVL